MTPRRLLRAAAASLWVLVTRVLVPSSLTAQGNGGEAAPPIQDNSFILEEAYNQEPGVVQHISNLTIPEAGGWIYTFTQEWPLGSIRHQLGFTLPIIDDPGPSGLGLGDIFLNYRYQLVGSGETRLAFAPRLSLILPTGDYRRGQGDGGLGVQMNLPLSVVVTPWLATHWNAGLTLIPEAADDVGDRATLTLWNLGASALWIVAPKINLLLEGVWVGSEDVIGPGNTAGSSAGLIGPGVRFAIDCCGGLQIVPGAAYYFAVGDTSGDNAVFLYLSFEHPF